MTLGLQLRVIIWSNTLVQLYKKMLFLELVQKIWNSLPKCLRNCQKKEFTKELHTLLLNILDNENDYVDVPMIVQRMSV